MRSLTANALFVAGLLAPLCLNAQPRGAAHSFAGSRGYYRSYAPAPRAPVRPRPAPFVSHSPSSSASSNSNSRPAPNLQIQPATGTSLINPGEASCLLNPSFAGSLYCRQYFSGVPSLGVEPVYPYWMPSGGYETEEAPPPAPEPEPENQLAAQVGNLAAEVEMMREDQALRDSRGAPLLSLPRRPP